MLVFLMRSLNPRPIFMKLLGIESPETFRVGDVDNVNKIVHLLPFDGIGGVEIAALSMDNLKCEGIEFEVAYIFREGTSALDRWATLNLLGMLSAVNKILAGDIDVLIVSLWRSAIVGILAKFFRPKLKLVVFSHNSIDVHWLDYISTRLSINLAHEIWADSQASLRKRFPRLLKSKIRIISFVTRNFEVLPSRKVSPDFIFWGRITAQKGLDHALLIFAEVLKQNPAARFWIIGPDRGALFSIQQLCKSLGLQDNVFFLGAATMDEIVVHALEATFYLQTSRFEGMAMSVVEAMQMGLVPIVSPVGEIPYYCSHYVNALIVKTDRQVVEDVNALLSSNEKYKSMKLNVVETWKNKPVYAHSVFQACTGLLAGPCNAVTDFPPASSAKEL